MKATMGRADSNGNGVSIPCGIRRPEENLGRARHRPAGVEQIRRFLAQKRVDLMRRLARYRSGYLANPAPLDFAGDFRDTQNLCMFSFPRKGYIIHAFTQPRRDDNGLPRVQLRKPGNLGAVRKVHDAAAAH